MKLRLSGQTHSALLLSVSLLFSACGGGGTAGAGGATAAGAFTFTIGGTVSGLTGSVVLQNNLGDNLTVSGNGIFTFATPVTSDKNYSVTVLTQPAGQTCSVSTGIGTVSASNVSNIAVICSGDAHTIGGSATGLSGFMVLQVNNSDNLTVATNSSFTFASKIAYGSPYNVSVLTQPTGQTCTVSNGSGTISSSNVSNVAVACTTNTYTIGGTVAGLTGTVVLQNNNGDNLTVNTSSSFTFASNIAYGNPYSVTVLTQPTGQTCSVSTGAGTVTSGNIDNVAVVCSINAYTISGTVSGLSGYVVLQDNSGDNLIVGANGPFSFATKVAYGSPYSVTVFTRPSGQVCSVANGSGTVSSANVVNVAINCANVMQMGGALQGVALNLVPTVSTFVGPYYNPAGLTSDGTNLYIANTNDNMIRKIVIATGVVTTLAGSGATGAADGPGATATFNQPFGITTDGTNLYVTDTWNRKIRKIVIATGVVSSLTGVANTIGTQGATDGAGATAAFHYPNGITTDGTNLYVVDEMNNKIRKIAPSSGTLSSMTSATAVVSSLTGVANTAGVSGVADGAGTAATFADPYGITTDGTNLYVVDPYNRKIRKIVIATGVVSSFTGVANTIGGYGAADGASTAATFNYPYGITCDGTNLYVTDSVANKIRKIVIATGVVSSVTGVTNTASARGAADGAGTTATFYSPYGITTDGSSLYIADYLNYKIRKIQ